MKTNSPTSKKFLNEEEVLLINNKDLTIKRKISLTKEQQLNDIYNESINLNSLNNEEDSPEVQSKFHSKFMKQYNENYRNIFHPVHSYKTIDSSFRAILLDYKTDKRTKLKKILLCYR